MAEIHAVVSSGCGRLIAHGIGSSRAISRSNSRNRIATRKNRSENGRRAEPIGSKPHSYGESFSVSGVACGSQKLMAIRSDVMPAVVENIVVRVIIYPQV